jgi:hypothetical protein
MNVSNFIHKHPKLCISTLGLVIVLYLGCHAVKWIINKCKNTQKIHQVAQPILNNRPTYPTKSLINRVRNLEVNQNKITVGQGEYVVFRKLPSGENQPLSRTEYEAVYKILLQHSPGALVSSGSPTATEDCANRYELLKAKLKEIDPALEAVFIPKTLYELIFIRKCIEEDLQHQKICPYLDRLYHCTSVNIFSGDASALESFKKDTRSKQIEKNCWHLCYFGDAGDSEHPDVKDIAYRINQVILDTFKLNADGFTAKELAAYTEEEIKYLKNFHETNTLCNRTYPGPTTNFGNELTGCEITPMGIRNDADAQIIRNAVTLDCSKIAQRAFLIYRGADFQKDSGYCWDDQNKPYSLSYGSSLFAGCIFDGGATSFRYMRNGQNAYAIPVPFDQAQNSPFFVPTTHTVAQLFGNGEVFHARSKAWNGYDLTQLKGVDSLGKHRSQRDHLASHLSREELITQVGQYKNQALQLK